VLQLEQEKVKWSHEKIEFLNKAMVSTPIIEIGSNTEEIV
jgi:hypothetical protein